VELIERRQRWLQVVGPQESDDSGEEFEAQGGRDDVEWDFDTVKQKPSSHRTPGPMNPEEPSIPNQVPSQPAPSNAQYPPAASQTPNPVAMKPDRLQALQQDNRNRSASDTATPKLTAEVKPPSGIKDRTRSVSATNGQANQPGSTTSLTASQNNQRPSALTSVIYPVLSKLLKSNQEEAVIAALAQLKIAFDNAERAKPGITHSLIAQIIETLKR